MKIKQRRFDLKHECCHLLDKPLSELKYSRLIHVILGYSGAIFKRRDQSIFIVWYILVINRSIYIKFEIVQTAVTPV